jgi:hypothetical protein
MTPLFLLELLSEEMHARALKPCRSGPTAGAVLMRLYISVIQGPRIRDSDEGWPARRCDCSYSAGEWGIEVGYIILMTSHDLTVI